MHALSKIRSIVVFIIFAAGCGSQTTSKTANEADDPLTEKPAKLGETKFSCGASLKQYWPDNQKLELKTAKKSVLLKQDKPFLVEELEFNDGLEKPWKHVGDSPNISYPKLQLSFLEEKDSKMLDCEAHEWELHLSTITTFKALPRSVSASSSFCWNPRGKTIKAYQSVTPGPKLEAPGQQISQKKATEFFTTDIEATPVAYSVVCTRG